MTGRSRLLGLALAVLAVTAGCTTGGDQQTVVAVTVTVGVSPASPSASASAAPGGTTRPSPTAGPTTPASSPSTRPPASSTSPPVKPVPPQAYATAADVAAAQKAVAAMTTAERAGAVVMASSSEVVGTDLVGRLHLGGVILMGSNGVVDGTSDGTPEQVTQVTARLQQQNQGAAPLLIGTDQEYGEVTRLEHGFTSFPGASELAAIPDTATAVTMTERVAAAAAAEMLAVGINVDFAPDADVLPEEGASSIGDRSYGSDPGRVGRLVTAAVTGYQKAGLPATLKHFPGIGSLAADTHEELPTLDEGCQQWAERDRVPMAAGVKAGAALAMTGHVRFPEAGNTERPASVDKSVVTGLLRGRGQEGCPGLGFTGVTVTDSLQMVPIANRYDSGEAAVAALLAGQDLLLMPVDPAKAVAGITAAVKAGTLPEQRLIDAATRVYALRLAVARTKRPSMSVISSPAHQELADEVRSLAG